MGAFFEALVNHSDRIFFRASQPGGCGDASAPGGVRVSRAVSEGAEVVAAFPMGAGGAAAVSAVFHPKRLEPGSERENPRL